MTFIDSPNKFGFYYTNNIKTYSKLEAAEQKQEVYWNFNDEVFSSFDWTVEPDVDLWNLYKERARQLRKQYDHVALFYSGGADSHNMLKAWIDADCKIDEIVHYWDYPSVGNDNPGLNAEILNVAIPHINSLKEQLSYKFMHTIIDMMEVNQNFYKKNLDDVPYTMNFWWNAYAMSRSDFREMPHWKSMIESGKKVAFIYGFEKPFVFYNPNINKHFFMFCDALDNNGPLPTMQKNRKNGWFDEFFYWSPDCPLIPIKQSHIIKRFLSEVDDVSFYKEHNDENYYLAYNPINKMTLKENVQNQLIYPKWNPETYSFGKPHHDFKNRPTGVLGDKDPFFLRTNTDSAKNYVKIFKSTIAKFMKANNYSINRPRLYYSRRYYLER